MGYIGNTKHRIDTDQQEKNSAMVVNSSVVSLFESLSEIIASQDKRIVQLGEKLNNVIDNQNKSIEAHFHLAESFNEYLKLKTII